MACCCATERPHDTRPHSCVSKPSTHMSVCVCRPPQCIVAVCVCASRNVIHASPLIGRPGHSALLPRLRRYFSNETNDSHTETTTAGSHSGRRWVGASGGGHAFTTNNNGTTTTTQQRRRRRQRTKAMTITNKQTNERTNERTNNEGSVRKWRATHSLTHSLSVLTVRHHFTDTD